MSQPVFGALVLGVLACTGLSGFDDPPLPHQARPQGQNGSNGIIYHGGAVINGGANLYYIWYGNWSQDTEAAAILTALARGIGGSTYFNINTTYAGMEGDRMRPVLNAVRYSGSAEDNYSQGPKLSMSGVAMVVQQALANGNLPADPDGVYFVLSSPDVTEDGFCQTGCGWHGSGRMRTGR